jgi:Na+/glutamate symporter
MYSQTHYIAYTLFFILVLCIFPMSIDAQDSGKAATVPKVETKKLDSKTRVKMVAALVGIAILGFGIMAATWLGGRFTRRIVNSKSLRPALTPEQLTSDEWAKKPLTMEERERLFDMMREIS